MEIHLPNESEIDKTFSVADKDLLQDKIDDETDETQSEQKYLEAIKKRRVALDEVDLMLDKIEKLESHINPEAEKKEAEEKTKQNPTKRYAKRD